MLSESRTEAHQAHGLDRNIVDQRWYSTLLNYFKRCWEGHHPISSTIVKTLKSKCCEAASCYSQASPLEAHPHPLIVALPGLLSSPWGPKEWIFPPSNSGLYAKMVRDEMVPGIHKLRTPQSAQCVTAFPPSWSSKSLLTLKRAQLLWTRCTPSSAAGTASPLLAATSSPRDRANYFIIETKKHRCLNATKIRVSARSVRSVICFRFYDSSQSSDSSSSSSLSAAAAASLPSTSSSTL